MDVHNASAPKLVSVDLSFDIGPLPASVKAFLVDADARIDAFFETHRHAERMGFFPSDYSLAYAVLDVLSRLDDRPHGLCEWGCGFGVVGGLGALLGYDACGIEIDPRLVQAARDLLAEHSLEVDILEGSFVPPEYAVTETLSDGETRTILSGAGGVDEVDVEIGDFDVVFAFPWPTEEDLYHDLFSRFAAVGALLITYDARDGIHVYRKVHPCCVSQLSGVPQTDFRHPTPRP